MLTPCPSFAKVIGNWQVGGNFSVAVAKKSASGGFDTKTMVSPRHGFCV
jgi:hypothetical protein